MHPVFPLTIKCQTEGKKIRKKLYRFWRQLRLAETRRTRTHNIRPTTNAQAKSCTQTHKNTSTNTHEMK